MMAMNDDGGRHVMALVIPLVLLTPELWIFSAVRSYNVAAVVRQAAMIISISF